MNFTIPVAASSLLALALALPGCSHPAQAASQRATPVKVQSVAHGPSASTLRYSGSLEPASQVTTSFRISGYVEALGQATSGGRTRPLDKGDFVRKGTLLARVRPDDYQHQLATGNAAVSDASAKAQLKQIELERAQRLFAAKAISQAELDATVAQAQSAQAALQDAQARTGVAALALDDTVLRAPMDGVVLSRQVEVGTLIAPGQPALTIADVRTVKAVFGAPQALVEQLSPGAPVQVFVGAQGEDKAPEKLLGARVSRIAPAADSNGRVFSVEAQLSNPNGELRPGAVVSVRVPNPASTADTLVVPLSAVVRSPHDPHGFSVFVLEGPSDREPARQLDVELGEVIGNSVTVPRGLAQNQRVVTVGASLLHDGSDAVVIR
jgi:membrane fusion protein, multidrug efflux system